MSDEKCDVMWKYRSDALRVNKRGQTHIILMNDVIKPLGRNHGRSAMELTKISSGFGVR